MILILSVVNRICRLSAITKTPWKHFCFAYIQTCLFNDNSVRAYIFYFFAKKKRYLWIHEITFFLCFNQSSVRTASATGSNNNKKRSSHNIYQLLSEFYLEYDLYLFHTLDTMNIGRRIVSSATQQPTAGAITLSTL